MSPSSWPSTEARRRRIFRLAFPLFLLLAFSPSGGQSISSSINMSFGSFSAGGGGTISLTAGGARTKTGGVLLTSQGALPAAAQFTLSGTPSANVVISLPLDGTTQLDDGSGHFMALNSFVSSPGPVGTLSGGGTLMLSVGATLTVGNLQAPGSYSGFFTVTINYE
ncbi:DUF4402 domain-containing protein [Pelomonas sp. V22]|uniref:DUF4402 domain-containing protein n=1 Tax=Pelomonas sp. V22 TaxID=2822139 RepID=UPI0024A80475|nr:DUF4402 domain-containing protein [Pelomonas sp. V22]MDI4631616.1 DUF4402 domain-containing protein [Pelomonas sp. V22]